MEVWSQTSGCRRTLPSLPDHRTNHDGGMVDGRPVVCGGDRQVGVDNHLLLWQALSNKAYMSGFRNPHSCLKLNPDLRWEHYLHTRGNTVMS